jgi:hypothetical protein
MKYVAHEETNDRQAAFQTKDFLTLTRAYIGQAAVFHQGPQALLVEMPKTGSTIHPHFHDVDQFQIIVKGGGKLGREDARPVCFHYADAYAPYGPIIAGEQGIAFFTLRLACEGGYFPMPGSRHLMPGRPGRVLTGYFAPETEAPRGEVTRQALIDQPDGVQVADLRLGPNARASGMPSTAGGQYYLVLRGSLLHGGREYGELSVVENEAGAPAPDFKAGKAGAALLMLQFAPPSARPGTDLKKLAARNPEYIVPEGLVPG